MAGIVPIDVDFGRQPSGERKLWGEVLCRVVADLCAKPGERGEDVRRDAIAWIGRFPSRDFRLVCSLAGLDADAVHPWFVRATAMPPDQLWGLVPHISNTKRRKRA